MQDGGWQLSFEFSWSMFKLRTFRVISVKIKPKLKSVANLEESISFILSS